MVHWVFILVGLAVGCLFGACFMYLLFIRLAKAHGQVMGAVKEGTKEARFG